VAKDTTTAGHVLAKKFDSRGKTMRNTGSPVLFVFVLLTILACPPAFGAVPTLISYQGELNDQFGAPVNGTIAFEFSIYDVPSGGVALWTETQSIAVSNGIFNVQLGADTPLAAAIFVQETLYLGIKAGADQEMTPRQRLTSAAFVQTAEQLSHKIQGEEIAREAVWPEHAGRSNTIVSYHAAFAVSDGTVSFAMPADKIFIITDIKCCVKEDNRSSAIFSVSYDDGGSITDVFDAVWYTHYGDSLCPPVESFRSGIPIPAGTTLRVTKPIYGVSSCVVSGFEIAATP